MFAVKLAHPRTTTNSNHDKSYTCLWFDSFWALPSVSLQKSTAECALLVIIIEICLFHAAEITCIGNTKMFSKANLTDWTVIKKIVGWGEGECLFVTVKCSNWVHWDN